MRHEALPQSLTVEQLAQWLYENKIDSKSHTEEEAYTEEEIQEFEHKSSLASRSIDGLDDIEKRVKEHLKEGIFDEPVSITLPPTNGRKTLTANRKYADDQILKGFSYREIDLYGIPDEKTEKILFFDAEGNMWDDYSENMSEDQKHQYIGMFSKDKVDGEDSAKADAGIAADVESEDNEGDVNEEPSMENDATDPVDTEEKDPEEEKVSPQMTVKPANASEEQNSEQDSVVIVDEVNLDEEEQGSSKQGSGAF